MKNAKTIILFTKKNYEEGVLIDLDKYTKSKSWDLLVMPKPEWIMLEVELAAKQPKEKSSPEKINKYARYNNFISIEYKNKPVFAMDADENTIVGAMLER